MFSYVFVISESVKQSASQEKSYFKSIKQDSSLHTSKRVVNNFLFYVHTSQIEPRILY